MAEEFYMQVSMELLNKAHQQDIETLIEHFELYEKNEAIALMSKYQPELMAESFNSSISAYSDYAQGDDIIDMYLTCYDESVEDMDITHTNKPIGLEISIEGSDNNAVDYCSALLLVLKGMAAKSIQAKAGSDYWQALWVEKDDGRLTITLEEYQA